MLLVNQQNLGTFTSLILSDEYFFTDTENLGKSM